MTYLFPWPLWCWAKAAKISKKPTPPLSMRERREGRAFLVSLWRDDSDAPRRQEQTGQRRDVEPSSSQRKLKLA